ncbi:MULTISPECIES: hypothetical protein [unclassified Nocardioides]|uniref:hypothetical protein n=1 Tax=unclassified Nocardioides TaxID=2615069 RepID=UPI0009EC2E05|nr:MULTISPECIES: hypothetical protein [unclassified Nocardioides]
MTINRSTAVDRDRCLVTVCRGCCCGDAGRHPGVDHAAHFDELMRGLGNSADVRVTNCLLVCGESNVVVVSPTQSARVECGARPIWLGRVLDSLTVASIVRWVKAGGPGRADLPSDLATIATEPFTDLVP